MKLATKMMMCECCNESICEDEFYKDDGRIECDECMETDEDERHLIESHQALVERVRELESALLPFANYSLSEVAPNEPNDQYVSGVNLTNLPSTTVTVGDFRKAGFSLGYDLEVSSDE